MKKVNLILLVGVLLFSFSCRGTDESQEGQQDLKSVHLRLKWAFQGQFAGYLVAKEKGFYAEAGLDVEIRPGGPDSQSYQTCANGVDDIGVGVPAQVMMARSNGVPLVFIAQMFQDSPNRFVAKRSSGLSNLKDVKGRKVGLWLTGDEIEFPSMLESVGLSRDEVDIVPQKFSISPFLEDEYAVSQVMTYNELLQIEGKGFVREDLTIFTPSDYGAALLGDGLFTSQSFLDRNPKLVISFLAATFKGWDYTRDHQKEALDIVMKYNPELDRELQEKQIQEVLKLTYAGSVNEKGLGYMETASWKNTLRVLRKAYSQDDEVLRNLRKVDPESCFDTKYLPSQSLE